MVEINGTVFGNEKYKNGETIFRVNHVMESLTFSSMRDVCIKVNFHGYEDVFKTCMAIEYAKEFTDSITVQVINFFMVDKLADFKRLINQLGIEDNKITIHKSYNHDYHMSNKDYTCDGALKFNGDASIGEFLLYDTRVNSRLVYMYYIPYARMDRVVADKIFAFKYFANIINSFKFAAVYAYDTHNATTQLINRLTVLSIYDVLEKVINAAEPDIICYPDSGAYNKYSKELVDLVDDYKLSSLYAVKLRDDIEHEKILKYSLNIDGVDLTGKKVLIIDDICSTGGTIIKAATALKEHGAGEIDVYVSHCENSVFSGPLFASGLINKIYTTNSLDRNKDCELIKVYNI